MGIDKARLHHAAAKDVLPASGRAAFPGLHRSRYRV